MNITHKVDFYTSHEALNLFYDSAQTRRVPRKSGWFNLSAHLVWLGNRTQQIDGAHIEYLRGIRNPIGIKVGPPFDLDNLRSEEHTSELQSRGQLVCRLLLEKKKIG